MLSENDADVIASYSKPTYVLGNTSATSLEASASRLSRRGLAELDGSEYPKEEEISVSPLVQTEAAEISGSQIFEMPG
jgi:hypothetical protein